MKYPSNSLFKAFICLAIAILPSQGIAEAPPAPRNASQSLIEQNKRCDAALKASLDVIKAQDASIANLKANVARLTDEVADLSRPPLLPTWGWIVIGAAAGSLATTLLLKR